MKNYKYDGSRPFSIKRFDCADKGEFKQRHEAIEEFTENLEKINEYQQRLFAEQKEGIIFAFQAMDAAGKDGAIRAVLSCLSPQGVSEHSFKVPSAEENRHDYLWRFWSALPEKGMISIFNRSHYEDVLVQKIHKIYENNKYADRIDMDKIIEQRYVQIRNFEKYLWENSIRVVKIFLCVSPEEQARRFISRIDTPKKNWKFSSGDIDERAYWDEYMDAYETCINKTARKHAPWYVVPADHKWYARLIISRIVLNELKSMDPKWPELAEDEKANLQEYRALLESQIGPEEPEEDDGKKLKPSDTAVGIALKKDRQALSEKKFRKQLEKSVFQNFCDRFGVSDQTRDVLGKAYLDIEEAEAKAEADDLDAVKQVYQSRKDALKQELCGCGKEARKLLEHYKKASKARIDAFVEEINLGYAAFEEDLKRFMVEYELEVSAEDACAEDAAKAYCEKLEASYEAHRSALADSRAQTEQNLNEIAEEYSEIAKGFRTHPENEAEEEPAAADAEATEEVPAEDTEITENVETPAQNADPA